MCEFYHFTTSEMKTKERRAKTEDLNPLPVVEMSNNVRCIYHHGDGTVLQRTSPVLEVKAVLGGSRRTDSRGRGSFSFCRRITSV